MEVKRNVREIPLGSALLYAPCELGRGRHGGTALECRHATIVHFWSSTEGRTSAVCHSLLWANSAPPSSPEVERAEALRPVNAPSAGNHSAGATTGFYARRNPAVVFRLCQGRSGFGALEETIRT